MAGARTIAGKIGAGVAVACSVFFTAMVSFHPGGATRWIAFDNVGQCLAAAIAVGRTALSAVRSDGRERIAWAFIATGIVSWTAGQVLWTIAELRTGSAPVSPSSADVMYLLSPLLVISGLLLFIETKAGALSRLRGVIEALLIAGGSLIGLWCLLLAPQVESSAASGIEEALTLAYPVLDAVGLSSLLFMATRGRKHRHGSLVVVGVGIWFIAISDSSLWYLTTVRDSDGVNASDAGWFIGFLLLGYGAVRRPHQGWAVRPWLAHKTKWAAVVLPQIVGVIGFSVALGPLGAARTDRHGTLTWLLAAVGIVSALHGLAVLVENHILNRDLERRIARRTATLAARERHFSALLENSFDATIVVDSDLRISFATAGGQGLFGWEREHFLGKRLEEFGEDVGPLVDGIAASLRKPSNSQSVTWSLSDPQGSEHFFESKITNLLANSDVGGLVINTRDVTERIRLERAMRYQAFHDDLSGLANRALFNDRAEHALARANRTGAQLAIMIIDLDGFKNINDSLGHQAGDALLVGVAHVLRSTARDGDTVARLGGDEFAILMDDVADANDALSAAQRFRLAIRGVGNGVAATASNETSYPVSASIGVAVRLDLTSTVGELLRDADTAMYSAKDSGRDAVRLFERSMQHRAQSKFRLQSDLGGAVDRGEFALYYQPCWTLATGQLEGFEALIRWLHPQLGLVPPDEFISLAEESGAIVAIGKWALGEATRQLAVWLAEFGQLSHLTMAINVSARQIRDPKLAGDVTAAIASARLDPSRIILELTESVFVKDPSAVASVLRALKKLGIHIAIDDFGTGYSSLSYLQDLPIDILKIDKAFVDRDSVARGSAETEGLLRWIVGLARSLGLRTVAEGIERSEQAEALRAVGCDYGQGYFWSRPLPAEQATTLLRDTPMAAVGLDAGGPHAEALRHP